MAFQAPCIEPNRIVAGDTASWTRSFSDFPTSEGWALSYSFAKLGQDTNPINVTSTVSGGQFVIAADTSAWDPGVYVGQGFVTKGTERHTIWQGKIQVDANFKDSQVPDQRSTARKIVDYIDANMSKLVQKQAGIAKIEGVEITFRNAKELLDVRNFYEAIALREDAAASGRRRNTILAVFTRPQ